MLQKNVVFLHFQQMELQHSGLMRCAVRKNGTLGSYHIQKWWNPAGVGASRSLVIASRQKHRHLSRTPWHPRLGTNGPSLGTSAAREIKKRRNAVSRAPKRRKPTFRLLEEIFRTCKTNCFTLAYSGGWTRAACSERDVLFYFFTSVH